MTLRWLHLKFESCKRGTNTHCGEHVNVDIHKMFFTNPPITYVVVRTKKFYNELIIPESFLRKIQENWSSDQSSVLKLILVCNTSGLIQSKIRWNWKPPLGVHCGAGCVMGNRGEAYFGTMWKMDLRWRRGFRSRFEQVQLHLQPKELIPMPKRFNEHSTRDSTGYTQQLSIKIYVFSSLTPICLSVIFE